MGQLHIDVGPLLHAKTELYMVGCVCCRTGVVWVAHRRLRECYDIILGATITRLLRWSGFSGNSFFPWMCSTTKFAIRLHSVQKCRSSMLFTWWLSRLGNSLLAAELATRDLYGAVATELSPSNTELRGVRGHLAREATRDSVGRVVRLVAAGQTVRMGSPQYLQNCEQFPGNKVVFKCSCSCLGLWVAAGGS